MKNLIAEITEIQNNEILNIITLDFNKIEIKILTLELKENVKLGKEVILSINPSSIILSKNYVKDMTCLNQIPVSVDFVDSSELLTTVNLKIENSFLESIITTQSFEKLDIKRNSEVIALIKESDISILKVIDD